MSASVAYDCPFTLKTYIVHIYQALYFPELEHNLINPNQCRLNNVVIDECPKFLSVHATDETHSIYFPREGICFPLSTHGIHLYLPTQKPTRWELDTLDELELTSNDLRGDPHAKIFSEQEDNMLDNPGNNRGTHNRARNRSVAALGLSQVTNSLSNTYIVHP